MKPQPAGGLTPGHRWADPATNDSGVVFCKHAESIETCVPESILRLRCPYGQPGDHLWVRETWRTAASLDPLSPHGMANKAIEAGYKKPWAPIKYDADGHEVYNEFSGPWGKTRVSIHMPRWASRLTLEVTEVRVQRVQDISGRDAYDEGINGGAPFGFRAPDDYRSDFATLWDSINGERPGCSWESNPWVWAISFKVLQ